MTIKVHEGIVLAADSASTLVAQLPDGSTTVVNVYDNANKIVNLVKGLPLGVITWGSGSIGPRSMTSIFKDLRRMLAGDTKAPDGSDWTLNRQAYTVGEVSDRVKEYIADSLYNDAFASWPEKPALGMIVAGYSSGSDHPEEFQIEVNNGVSSGPTLLRPGAECGITAGGQPETVSRLVFGYDPRLAQVLEHEFGVPASDVPNAMGIIQQHLGLGLVQDAMPMQDAIDLGRFLVETTINLVKFSPGAPTVGGPVELAAITQHEGFKWVRRKHYYHRELNPGE